MPMSSGGRVASSSGCATKPKAREIGWTGYAGLTQHSLRIGHYVMATAEHREPCDSRGSCTVLGAPGGEIPPGDSAIVTEPVEAARRSMSASPQKRTNGQRSRQVRFVPGPELPDRGYRFTSLHSQVTQTVWAYIRRS